jgi:hypothetical protein
MDYLSRFGYLPPPPSSSPFNDAFSWAGVINGTSTMARNASLGRGRHLYSYFPGSPMWPPFRRDLKYALTSTSETTIDRATLSAVFARWAAATNLRFTVTTSEVEADLTIGFHAGAHGDGEPFDGPLGTLAHAFSPTDQELRIRFNCTN